MPKRVIALSRSSPAERTLGFWRRNARHANLMARRVRDGLAAIPGVRFRGPTEIDCVVVALPQPIWDGLVAEGYSCSRRAPSEGIIRIVCAFDTTEEDVDELIATAKRYAGVNESLDAREGLPILDAGSTEGLGRIWRVPRKLLFQLVPSE